MFKRIFKSQFSLPWISSLMKEIKLFFSNPQKEWDSKIRLNTTKHGQNEIKIKDNQASPFFNWKKNLIFFDDLIILFLSTSFWWASTLLI